MGLDAWRRWVQLARCNHLLLLCCILVRECVLNPYPHLGGADGLTTFMVNVERSMNAGLFRSRVEMLRAGEPVELLVLSKDNNFSSFKVRGLMVFTCKQHVVLAKWQRRYLFCMQNLCTAASIMHSCLMRHAAICPEHTAVQHQLMRPCAIHESSIIVYLSIQHHVTMTETVPTACHHAGDPRGLPASIRPLAG